MMHQTAFHPAATACPPIWWPGVPRWYALRTAPLREDQAEDWLRRRGVYAFHPVLTRQVLQRGRLRVHHRRYLPGYTFARFPGDPVRHSVMACPFIVGAVTLSSGEWGVLDPARLRAVHAMRRLDAAAEDRRRAAADAARQAVLPRAGGAALFCAGPFAGQRCEVVSLTGDGGARVALRLFGGPVEVEARARDLVALHKAS